MPLSWMGKYHDLVYAMVSMGNAYSQLANVEIFGNEIKMTPTQLQLMGYIIESEELNQNMARIAERFSFTKSNFSKMIKQLEKKGLIEKFHTAGNSKNVIIRASDLGKALYEAYTASPITDVWKQIFSRLDKLDDETVKVFIDCLNDYTTLMQRGPERAKKELADITLVKIK